MPKQGEDSLLGIVWRNVFTLFNLLNVALAGMLFFVGSYRNLLFLGVVVSNALIGLVQEWRAKKMHDRLQLLSEGKIRTLRDGALVRLAPAELVREDVVRLSRGEQVPADARVLAGACEANEALLTGESDPVGKNPGDSLKSGSFLTEGSVTAVLTAVGKDSYAGHLQMAARKVHRSRSELMEGMGGLVRFISIAILPLGLLLYGKQTHFLGLEHPDAVTKTVAAMLGMIPEGLILLTSLALAAGAIRLGKQKALVNQLYGIESLARTDVICMDKTGTLTNGAMSLERVLPLNQQPQEVISACMVAFLDAQEEEGPTQDALRRAFGIAGTQEEYLQRVSFASQRKWAAVQFAKEALGTVVMGAPERLLPPGDPAREQAQACAEQGLRVLLLARSGSALPETGLPEGLQGLALLCLRDTLRPQVEETLRYFEAQGVELKVLSGDHPGTVASVARQAGLPGAERLVDLSVCEAPVDYGVLCEAYTLFARVSPEDKRGLVEALKQKGHGVAMIGDGVNDIPALKAADCSIAMAGGSDAACRVAQITLLDESFSAMPQILQEGRRVINNITQASSLFLVKNIFSFLLTALLLLLPFPYPFVPIQLTLIATSAIGIPSFVLALQPNKERVQGRFLQNMVAKALPGGLVTGLLVVALCLLHRPLQLEGQRLGTFCVLAAGITGLWVLWFACLPLNGLRAALIAAMSLLFTVSVMAFPGAFYLSALSLGDLPLVAGLLAVSPLCLWGGMGLVSGVLRAREKAYAPPRASEKGTGMAA